MKFLIDIILSVLWGALIMLNDIFYFINENEKNILKDSLNLQEGDTFTILKKFESNDKFNEKLLVINSHDELVDEIDATSFTHLVIDRPYLVSKDRF